MPIKQKQTLLLEVNSAFVVKKKKEIVYHYSTLITTSYLKWLGLFKKNSKIIVKTLKYKHKKKRYYLKYRF